MKNADDIAAFLHLVRARLEKGAEEYGEASFARPYEDLLQEVLEEAADIAGWAAIVACKIYATQRKAPKLPR